MMNLSPIYVIFVISFNFLYCIHCSWIDPDTIKSYHIIKSNYEKDKNLYKLVFSDEFNRDGRNFKDGNDPRWTAMNKNDYTNNALQYYSHDLANTNNGVLNITTILKDVEFEVLDPFNKNKSNKKKTNIKNYQSGMINGWNKFCFTGGILEINAKLPGNHDVGGLWPAIWLLGNLARATYVGSSNNVWPWSYNACHFKNNKKTTQYQQEISACNIVNHYDLHSKQGRGAPEIDILEAMPGREVLPNSIIQKPYFSTSFQVSPSIGTRPDTNSRPSKSNNWYNHGIEYADNNKTDLNIFFYGQSLTSESKLKNYASDALSANTNLKKTHFKDFHKYRLEWITGEDGYLKWYLDDEMLYSISANALNITGAIIPEEPMYILLNTAISSTWGFPTPCPDNCDCTCLDVRDVDCECALPNRMIENFPSSFLIDYVRIYQSEQNKNQVVGCSPPKYPTKKYIIGHKDKYKEEHELNPLKDVITGGDICSKDNQCGNGWCNFDNKCNCYKNYTGGNCLASIGYDDIQWEIDDVFDFSTLYIPKPLLFLFIVLVGISLCLCIYSYQTNAKLQHEYSSIRGYPSINDLERAVPISKGSIISNTYQ